MKTRILIMAMVMLMLAGCSPKTVYVPTERIVSRTDTVYSATLRVDSVLMHDSVAVIQRGDTVYLTKYRDRFRYRERIDTLYQSVTDSVEVRVPYPVERELTKWERTKMDFGGFVLGGLIAAVIVAVLAWIVKRKRHR